MSAVLQQQQQQQQQQRRRRQSTAEEEIEDLDATIEEKNQLISRQYAEIERLQRELTEVIGERDALLCDVSKFKFELEMADLKRLQDDR
jgi:peptidoglycan hydrolase CwlO-like protein